MTEALRQTAVLVIAVHRGGARGLARLAWSGELDVVRHILSKHHAGSGSVPVPNPDHPNSSSFLWKFVASKDVEFRPYTQDVACTANTTAL